ncbi:unnamed protein product [Rhizophagus irregularis]|nr:unnamed protein product [Rhizophagus irregularis]
MSDIYDELEEIKKRHEIEKHNESREEYQVDPSCLKCYSTDEIEIGDWFKRFWKIFQKVILEFKSRVLNGSEKTIVVPMSSNNAPCNKFECKICGKIYKRRSGLTRHAMTIKEANSVKSTIYDLPEKAIEETRQVLVYHIKERLKQHSKHVGNVHIMVNCTKSQFFGVFKGHIHNYYPRTGNYKCIFKGVDSYSTLSHILGDDNWGAKYFLQHQKTFILTYQLPSNPKLHLCQEPDLLQEPDPLQDQTLMHAARKQRTRKPKPIQIVIGWKRKSKSDVRNIVYSSGFAFINFTISRTRVVDNLY